MTLDLRFGGEDHRCGLALDDRLDRAGDPVQQLDQLRSQRAIFGIQRRIDIGFAANRIRQITLATTMGPGIRVDTQKTRGIVEDLEETPQAAVPA